MTSVLSMRIALLGATMVLPFLPVLQDPAPAPVPSKEPTYPNVQLILNKRCVSCHNASTRRANINLSTYESIMKGGLTTPIVRPGEPDRSILVQTLHGKVRKRMPPRPAPAIAADEIVLIEAWIKAGAKNLAP